MCNRILETRGSFRAFYIVLLMLQQMQKLNGNRKIKDVGGGEEEGVRPNAPAQVFAAVP